MWGRPITVSSPATWSSTSSQVTGWSRPISSTMRRARSMREERASAISADSAVPSEESTSRASRCTLRCPCSEETSMPGTAATPLEATAAGSCGQPSTVS